MADWNEKYLETYTCDNIRTVVDVFYNSNGKNVPAWVIGRQISTSGGIIDALMVIGLDLYIVEFKAVRADQKALGQLQRYRSVVRHLSPYKVLDRNELYDMGALGAVEQLDKVKLMLVAPSFSKEALLGADICLKATYNDGGFTFSIDAYSDSHMESNPHLQDLITPYLNYLLSQHKKHVKHHEKSTLRRSAIETASHVN